MNFYLYVNNMLLISTTIRISDEIKREIVKKDAQPSIKGEIKISMKDIKNLNDAFK
jgi:hypothetical protein